MMKFIYMAVAAIAALSSCSNDNDPIVGETGKQALTFTASMEGSATRATLNTNKAEWEANDQISINGVAYKAKIAGATTTFEAVTSGQEATPDEGKYKAYFPATMYSSTAVTLPATYTYADGGFDMPMYAESTTTALQFKNLCGVLAITVPSSQMSSVTSIEVSSDQQMNGAISNITAQGVLTFASATLTSAEKKVTLTASSSVTIASSETFYVPVPAGTHNPLKITVSDGTNTKMMVTKKTDGVAVARNKIYPVTFAENYPEYVEIGGKKWATMNLGATTVAGSLATCAGDYYQWGSVNKLYESISWDGTSATVTFKSDKQDGFTTGNREIKDESVPDVLPAANDVVAQTLGGGWRMPTKADFEALHNACTGKTSAITKTLPTPSSSTPAGGVYWLAANQAILPEYTGVAGILYVDKTDTSKRVFFPAAGYVNGTSLYVGGTNGKYWSSSLSGNPGSAYFLHFYSSFVNPSTLNYRYFGYTVRPVSE